MIALDTNVIVRIVTKDDPDQLRKAVELLRVEKLWQLSKTVLLETEWVLRYCYQLDRETIGGAFRRLLGYRGLRVEDRGAFMRSLSWYAEGMDFADALHLASCSEAERFVTFDAKLMKRAKALQCEPAVELL